KVSATMIGHSLDGYLDGLQFGVGVPGGDEAIIHAVNRLVEDHGDDVGISMLLVDFQNAFNLVDRTVMLQEVRLHCPAISRVQQGDPLRPLLFSLVLHPLVCKIGDSFDLCMHAWYLDDGTVAGDTLVVGKVLDLITEDGSCCGLFLNVDKTELFWPKEDPRSRLEGCFPPNISRPLHVVKLLGGPVSVDVDFCDVLNYVFIALRLQSAALQTKLLRQVGRCPELMKKMEDVYCTRVTKDAKSSFSLSPRQMALWLSQREEHTSEWLRVVLISGLGKTMNGKTYRCVLCYRLGVSQFFVSKPCSACSKVFTGDVYGDLVVSCPGVIGIKHRHNVVHDTLVDICFRLGISAGKEVDIGLGGVCDKALRPANMLVYSWEGGLDVCVDLTGSPPLTQTGMANFVPGRTVIDDA
nr:putative reverse transcriptase domain-containing protein [Tanacetum cinerariifolium]